MRLHMKLYYCFFLVVFFIASCEGSDDGNTATVKTGRVTFVNESSYGLKVRRDSFSGPVVVEFLQGDFSKTVDVRTSDTHGFGTTFSIEYLYRIDGVFEADSGDIFASGLDFNVQINKVIEENKSYTISIPQPKNLEFRTAFIKIFNTHNLPIELRDFGRVLRQAGNNNIPISPGRTGIYSLIEIPAGGKSDIRGYNIVSTLESTQVPDFTVQNGFIYSFSFNGSSVTQTGIPQTIIFK